MLTCSFPCSTCSTVVSGCVLPVSNEQLEQSLKIIRKIVPSCHFSGELFLVYNFGSTANWRKLTHQIRSQAGKNVDEDKRFMPECRAYVN